MNKSIKNIYETLLNGDHLTFDDLQAGHKHFNELGKMLGLSGPAFHLAAKEAHRVADTMELYIQNRKMEAKSEDRHSTAYQDGYRTGIVWKDTYRPGGPFVMHAREHDNSEFQKRCEESQAIHRRWLMGFDEGLAAKKAGAKPTADMLRCDCQPQEPHGLKCLVRLQEVINHR